MMVCLIQREQVETGFKSFKSKIKLDVLESSITLWLQLRVFFFSIPVTIASSTVVLILHCSKAKLLSDLSPAIF